MRVFLVLAPGFAAEVPAAWALLSWAGLLAAAGEIVGKTHIFAHRVLRDEALVLEPLSWVVFAYPFSFRWVRAVGYEMPSLTTSMTQSFVRICASPFLLLLALDSL